MGPARGRERRPTTSARLAPVKWWAGGRTREARVPGLVPPYRSGPPYPQIRAALFSFSLDAIVARSFGAERLVDESRLRALLGQLPLQLADACRPDDVEGRFVLLVKIVIQRLTRHNQLDVVRVCY